jgi:hypothetical protein
MEASDAGTEETEPTGSHGETEERRIVFVNRTPFLRCSVFTVTLRPFRYLRSYGNPKTKTCPVVLGLSSGVTRSVEFATPDGPVATETYCFPSTENVIG